MTKEEHKNNVNLELSLHNLKKRLVSIYLKPSINGANYLDCTKRVDNLEDNSLSDTNSHTELTGLAPADEDMWHIPILITANKMLNYNMAQFSHV